MEQQNKPKQIIREFWLTNLALNNKTSVYVLMFLIFLMGFSAYQNMPKENFPEVKIPEVYIGVAYPGNAPIDMENLITRPIEKEINTIQGVDAINSTSIQDYTTIRVLFDMDMDIDQALIDVKDAVDRAKAELPKDLPADPNIFEMDLSEMPVMNINLSGFSNVDILEEYAEDLQDKIENLPEINRVDIRGVQEKEIAIEVDVNQMEARLINFYDIEQAIQQENVTLSAGDVEEGGLKRNVRIVGEFANVKDIENIIIKSEKQKAVYLKDVATVKFDYAETTSYSRSNLNPVVTLDIIKRSGANLLNATDKIKDILAYAEEHTLPEQLDVKLINDTSKITRNMVNNLENSIISGVILVVLVLLFFLGLRNALFVGIAIPLSMLMGILMLDFSGNTLNMMVLFSLILALGMLVDNGIVVVENVYRLMTQGYSPMRAAREGVGEVAMPIIVSTATTLGAFVPLLFWKDIMGEFMKFLPITLILVLSSSLFVALVINPVLTAVLMRVEDENKKTDYKKLFYISLAFIVLSVLFYMAGYTVLGSIMVALLFIMWVNALVLEPLAKLFNKYVMPFMEKTYETILNFALWKYMPIVFFGSAFLLLIGSFTYFGDQITKNKIQVRLFPDNEPNFFYTFIEFPIGTSIEKTNETTIRVEELVLETLQPYSFMVEAVLANVGEGAGDPQMDVGGSKTPNKSRVSVFFLEYEKRKRDNGPEAVSTTALMELVREKINDSDFPGVTITLKKEDNGPPTGYPINIEIIGENFEELIAVTQDVKSFLNDQNVSGVEELKLNLETSKPELILNIDRETARKYGLSTGRIAGDIRTSVFGKEVSTYKMGEDEYPINLRFKQEDRYNLSKVVNQRITFMDQMTGGYVQVPISAVAHPQYGTTYGSVNRKDLDRSITIYSNVVKGADPNKIVARYKKVLQNYNIPEGYQVKFTGQQEEQSESTDFLMRAFLIALGIILIIIISLFNSIWTPLIVLFSIIFSTIGVFLGYGFYEMDFIIILTGIGIISLAGIVVNNAIVLIDYINLIRRRKRIELGLKESGKRMTGEEVKESIVIGGKTRLRPVLLTAITTVLGLIPLAIGFNIDFTGLLTSFEPNIYVGGDNAQFWGPMAWAVIYGLIFSTFMTLVIVPVMYYSVDRALTWTFGQGLNASED